MLSDLQIVFIVCNGRSGSTLLQSIFDAHHHICAPIESKFILHLSTKYKNIKDWNEETIIKFCDDLYTNRKFRLFWKVEKNVLLKLFAKHAVHSFEDACKLVYLSYPSIFKKEKIHVLVDKNPAYSRFLKELSQMFPQAKYIHLVRDPRAVVLSQMNAFGVKNVYKLAHEWNLMNIEIIKLKNFFPEKFITIKYEDFVGEPEFQLKKIFNFLNLSFHEKLLLSYKTIDKNLNKNPYLNLPHHQNISNPITSQNIKKWEEQLTNKQIKNINNITYRIAAGTFGYSTQKNHFTFLENTFSMLSQIQVIFIHLILKSLFKLPFFIRKNLYAIVSFFFDKNHVSDGHRS